MERKYDWENIKDLNEINWIPDVYNIEEKLLHRTPLLMINHLLWNQLIDYKFYNQINSTGDPTITVHGYFSAVTYRLKRVKVVEIPANTPFNHTIQIKNSSSLRSQSVHQARIENALVDDENRTLRNYLQSVHNIKDLEEYCPDELEEITIKGDGSVAEYDRIWVYWIIESILGIYREDTEGNIRLVSCSDYLTQTASAIYPKSNIYWVDRLKKETAQKKNSLL